MGKEGKEPRPEMSSGCKQMNTNPAFANFHFRGQVKREWKRGISLSAYLCTVVTAFLIAHPLGGHAATIHVWTNSPVSGPGTAWSNAWHTIQEAVDVAVSNDVVLVTNGVYNTGGAVTPGYALTNRVCVTNAVTIQSVNGRDVTIIEGASDNGTNGPAAIRGVYMANNAVLIGFTVTNGHTHHFSGNYVVHNEGGGGSLVEDGNGTLTNCTLTGNSASGIGGGMCYGTLANCTLVGNSAGAHGGGTYAGTLNNCVLTENSAAQLGGGVYDSDLNDCVISGNSAEGQGGGGAFDSSLKNCILTNNWAAFDGGGAFVCTLTNCTLIGNSAEKVSVLLYCYFGVDNKPDKMPGCFLWVESRELNMRVRYIM